MGIYKDFLRAYPDYSTADLAEIIQRSGRVNAQMKSIKGRIRATRGRLDRDDPGWRDRVVPMEDPPDDTGEDVTAESVKNPDRSGDSYRMNEDARVYEFFFSSGRTITIPFAPMQSVFEWYANPRSLQVRPTVRRLARDYGIEITENDFRRLKRPIGLTQSSLPYAPHMYKEFSPEVLEARYLEICESKLETKIRASAGERWYRKFEKERKKTLSVEFFFERIQKELPKLEIPDMEPLERSWELDPVDMVLIASDWHVGKLVDRAFNQYNVDVFHAYMEDLKRQIKDHFLASHRPVERFYICSVGDLIDGVAGNMHPQQDRHQDVHGAKQILYAGLALANLAAFCEQLLPQCETSVEYVVGNHDRITKDRRGDPNRVAGEAVFYMARETCPVDIEWNLHRHVVGEFRSRNTQVFLTHGDKAPKDFRKTIFARQDKTADTHLVVSGHLHHLKIIEDLNLVSVQGGSYPGKTDFSVDHLGKGSRASQAMLEIRDDGPRPLIWLPLKSDAK